jgi:tRNA C32,U32 (ribose-2'-O)-methylase TrmJ
MNLGQAVAVCLYEIAARIGGPTVDQIVETLRPNPITGPANYATPPASNRDLELLAGLVEETMLAANYSPPEMRNANRHDLHLLLRRLALTRTDAGRILGFFRRILYRLKQEPNRK